MKISYVILFLALVSFLTFSQPYNPEVQAQFEAYGFIEGAPIIEGIPYRIPESTVWDSTASAPNVFGRVSAGVIGNYLYAFCSQGVPTMAAAYNLTTKQWIQSTTSTSTGFNIGACVVGNQLYKLGTVFEKFTPAGDGTGTWTVLTAAPSVVRGAENSIVWDGNNYIYANAGTTTNYFYRYSISGDTWEQLTLPPVTNRRYAGLISLGGFIYRIGGLGETNWDGTLSHKYDPSNGTWTTIAPLPEPVNFTKWSTTTDGKYIYIVGSGGGFSTYPINSNTYMYNPAANTWTVENTLPAARGLALGIYLPSVRKLFLGGGNDGTSGTLFFANCWEGTGGPYIPVELSSFTAAASGSGIKLSWSTATEKNNKGFAVERSSDKLSWNELTFVNGKGTTTTSNNYLYSDESVTAGKYYYRLKQVDLDGSVEYSQIVETEYIQPNEFTLAQNYPNPFNPSTKIKYSVPNIGLVQLTVFDALGNEVRQLVNQLQNPGTYEVNFNASDLSSGIYFYKLTSGSFTSVMKMSFIK